MTARNTSAGADGHQPGATTEPDESGTDTAPAPLARAGDAALDAFRTENRAAVARLRACYELHELCVDEQFERDVEAGLIGPDTDPPDAPDPPDPADRAGSGTPDHAVLDPMDVACAELVARYGVHHNRARSLISLAVILVEQFPALLEAMEEGRLDERTAGMLARHMRTVDSRYRRRVQRELVEWLLAALAAGRRPGRDALLSETDRIIGRIDPDGIRERRAAAVRERHVTLRRRPDGMADLSAHLTAAEATSIHAALNATVAAALAREKVERECASRDFAEGSTTSHRESSDDAAATGVNGPDMPGASPFGPRPDRGERRADALVDAVLGAGACTCGATGADSPAPVVRPQVTVFAPIGPDDEPEVYFPRSSAASIDTLIALLSRSVGASISRPRTAPGTADSDRGRRRYRISRELARRIRLRDGTCRHPGCSVPAESCDVDHVVPFDRKNPRAGGATEECNLMCLCRRHHRLKTFYSWRYRLSRDGTLTVITSTGQKISTLPGGPLAHWRNRMGNAVGEAVGDAVSDAEGHTPDPDTADPSPGEPEPLSAQPSGAKPRLNARVRQTYWYRRARRIAAERQHSIDRRRHEPDTPIETETRSGSELDLERPPF